MSHGLRWCVVVLSFLAWTAAASADMTADSPVKFPKEGCLPAKYPPDRPAKDGKAPEEGYYLFSTPERSVEQVRKIQGEMPAGQFAAPQADWTNLQRTQRSLKEGGHLHLLALGDSIVNDTMRSGWVALLGEAYPKAAIRATVYVRGGGGCQHYKEQGRIAKVVVPLKPDLVLIGGISQKDIASIREVIHQLRAALPEVEVLLASGVFGTADPRDAAELAKAPHSGAGPYGEALRKLAAEEHCAYLDMTTPWAEYLRSSRLHPHHFYRDAVHANEFGEQVLAKILLAFFAPSAGEGGRTPASPIPGRADPASPAAVQHTFYVSPGGDDRNPGTEPRPFATLDRARQAVRQVNRSMTGDIRVVLRGGAYKLERTLVFEPEDSGTAGRRVIYASSSGESAVLSGGRRISGWQPDRDGRWQAPAALDDFRQLYVNGRRATRARGNPPAGLVRNGDEGYRSSQGTVADWRNPSDIEFCYQVVWCHTRCKVQAVRRDGSQAIISMQQPTFRLACNKEGVRTDTPTYMENALELLDEPGEWYFDRAAHKVYYLPRPGEDMTKAETTAPALERLVELRGTLDRPVANLQFFGLTFADAGWLEPSRLGLADVQANFRLFERNLLKRDGGCTTVHNEHVKSPANVVCHAARGVRFEDCTFTRLGGAGLDLEFGTQDSAVVGCRFHDISGTAVQVGDVLKADHHPDDRRAIVKNNLIGNNSIHDCAVEYKGGVGVFAGYTEGTIIEHNEICRLPYSGISIGWGWGEEDVGGGAANYHQPFRYKTPTPAGNNRVTCNHIHHVMQEFQDGGGIYTLGNQPGTVLRANDLHDNRGGPGGIYLDEGSGFIEVTGNLVYGVPKALNFNNGAQDRINTCKVHDNYVELLSAIEKSCGSRNLSPGHGHKVLPVAQAILGIKNRIPEIKDADPVLVEVAALLHDIGGGGPPGETKGPPLAREILAEQKCETAMIDRVCRIIATHHHLQGELVKGLDDTPEWFLVIVADHPQVIEQFESAPGDAAALEKAARAAITAIRRDIHWK
jgi:lysophospholipase L1-like esterase